MTYALFSPSELKAGAVRLERCEHTNHILVKTKKKNHPKNLRLFGLIFLSASQREQGQRKKNSLRKDKEETR